MERIKVENGIYVIEGAVPPDNPDFTVCAIGRQGYIHAACYQELVEAVYFGLRRLGFRTRLVSRVWGLSGKVILIGAHLLEDREIEALAPDVVVYNTEHADANWLTDSYLKLLSRVPAWDYSSDNASRLSARLDKQIHYVPLGYVPELTRVRQAEEDIDVLFYGSGAARREALFQKLRRCGLSFHRAFGIYGSQRDDLISRSKIILNVHQFVPGAFEALRVAYAFANSKAVVTEYNPGETIDPDLLPGLAVAPYEQLVDLCRTLALDYEARRRLGIAGYNAFSARSESDILASAIEACGFQPERAGVPTDRRAAISPKASPPIVVFEPARGHGNCHGTPKPKLFIVTPCAHDLLVSEYAATICHLTQMLARSGTEVGMTILSLSDLEISRSILASRFMAEPDYTHLLFIDSDTSFEPGLIRRMLDFNEDFVGVMCAKQTLDLERLIKHARQNPDEDTHAVVSRCLDYAGLLVGEASEQEQQKIEIRSKGGFVTAAHTGMGLCLLRRRVLETMVARGIVSTEGEPSTLCPVPYYGFFHKERVSETASFGEDFSFCRRWRIGCGGTIWASVDTAIGHHGIFTFAGAYVEKLKVGES